MEFGEGAVPPLQKFFGKLYAKIIHFLAKFSYVLRCIQSLSGRGGHPPGSATGIGSKAKVFVLALVLYLLCLAWPGITGAKGHK